MTNFSGNTRKNHLKQTLTALRRRAKNSVQGIELLKVKLGLSGLLHLSGTAPRHSKPRRSRAGLTLFEATLWSLLAISVLLGVLGLYNGVTDSIRTAALRSQLTRAVAIIERDHSQSGTYTGTSLLGHLNGEGFTSKELRRLSQGSYEFRTPYDTAITIAPDTTDNRKFTVTVAGLPASGCEAAVASFSERGAGLDSVKIGTADAITQSALTDAQISTNCDTDDGEATVVLTF